MGQYEQRHFWDYVLIADAADKKKVYKTWKIYFFNGISL